MIYIYLSWGEEEYSRRHREDISFYQFYSILPFMPTPVHTPSSKYSYNLSNWVKSPRSLDTHSQHYLKPFYTIWTYPNSPRVKGHCIQVCPPTTVHWHAYMLSSDFHQAMGPGPHIPHEPYTPYKLHYISPASQMHYPRQQHQKHAMTPLWHQLPLTLDPLELQTVITVCGEWEMK